MVNNIDSTDLIKCSAGQSTKQGSKWNTDRAEKNPHSKIGGFKVRLETLPFLYTLEWTALDVIEDT
jgi:hypothetical protein